MTASGRTKPPGKVIVPLLMMAALGSSPALAAGQVIPASRAGDHVGEEGTFEMTVRSSRNVKASQVYFLNSEADYHNPKNLTIVIEYEDADPFAKAKIADPAAFYRGKTIRVTGTVVRERNETRIRVTDVGQIQVVKAASRKKAG